LSSGETCLALYNRDLIIELLCYQSILQFALIQVASARIAGVAGVQGLRNDYVGQQEGVRDSGSSETDEAEGAAEGPTGRPLQQVFGVPPDGYAIDTRGVVASK
jgi:hypothetical protein